MEQPPGTGDQYTPDEFSPDDWSPDDRPRAARVVVVTTFLSVLAIAVSVVAIAVALTRPSGFDLSACRSVAWNALPAASAMPAGWTVTGSGFYVDGYGTTFVGPQPSSGSGTAPSAFVRVSCFGADGHQAVARSHAADLAAGGSDVAFAGLGDETFATRSASGSQTSVYVHRGDLVANFATSSGVVLSDLEQVARAVDDAMTVAEARGPSVAAATPSVSGAPSVPIGAGTTTGPAASVIPAAPASPAPVHAAPALEALLPHIVNGTTLTSQSATGGTVLGTDPSSLALTKALASLGKQPADLLVAEAYDPSGAVALQVIGFQVGGVTGTKLRQAILESWLAAAPSSITTTTVTISGKQVIKVDYGSGGIPDYLYEHGESAFDVVTADASLAATALGQLP